MNEDWNKLAFPQKIQHDISKNEPVTFAELDRIPEFQGPCVWYWSKKTNIIFWIFISKKAIETMEQMLEDRLIYMELLYEPGISTYLQAGKILRLPVVKKIKRKDFTGFKKPHWIPVAFYTHETSKCINWNEIKPKKRD